VVVDWVELVLDVVFWDVDVVLLHPAASNPTISTEANANLYFIYIINFNAAYS